MRKNIGLIVLVVLALSLGACTRAASTAAPQAVALATEYPQPLATEGMNVVEQAGTRTAVAQGTPLVSDTTPAPGENPTTAPGGAEATVAPVVDTPMPSPTPAVVTPQPTVATTKPGTYALKEGEFPFCIARRFNVDPQQLLTLNGLSNAQTFYAGLTLKIPTTGTFPGTRALKAHPTTYTVRTGDTIYSIACEVFGDVDPVNIAAVNGLSAPYTLTVGAQINIP